MSLTSPIISSAENRLVPCFLRILKKKFVRREWNDENCLINTSCKKSTSDTTYIGRVPSNRP